MKASIVIRVCNNVILFGHTMDLALKKADESDLLFYFHLKNDPTVLATAFDPTPIELPRHTEWFLRSMRDKDTYLYVIKLYDRAVGQMRINIDTQKHSGESHVAIAQEYRGRGYSSWAIREACLRVFTDRPDVEIVYAHMKIDNLASQKAFARAGFKKVGIVSYNGRECVEMVLQKNQGV